MEKTEHASGRCRVCGCTEERPCLDALVLHVETLGDNDPRIGQVSRCSWMDEARTLCDNLDCIARVPLSELEAMLNAREEHFVSMLLRPAI